jgi:hypothetical protein
MTHRAFAGAGLAGALAVAMVALTGDLKAQTPRPDSAAPAPPGWQMPRTEWGHPDLAGIWNNTVNTPLQRPSKFAGRMYLTDEEQKALSGQVQDNRDTRDSRQQPDDSVLDVARAYNALWFPVPEAPIRRTSLKCAPRPLARRAARGRRPAAPKA